MSANIDSMVSGRNMKPWHGLGVVVDGLMDSKQALKLSGLDWQVTKIPMEYIYKGKTYKTPRTMAIVREDTGAHLGVTGTVWKGFQNHEAFSWMDAVIGEKAAVYDTAGSLGVGEKVWATAKLNGVMRVKGTDDEIEKFLLFTNSFDGKTSIQVALTTVRVVCQNTLNMALSEAKEAKDLFKIRHTGQIGVKIEDVRKALGLANKWFEDFNAMANRLAEVKMNAEMENKLLAGIGLDLEVEGKRAEGKLDLIKTLIHNGAGNSQKGVKDTLWAGLNGITEYADYFAGTRKTDSFKSAAEARFAAAQFGSGQDLKAKALEVALKLAA